jgi:glutaredoxin 2
MGESLDIVRFIDEYAGKERLNEAVRVEVQTWYDEVNEYYNKLVQPRDIKLGLPEFATQAAMDYFVRKKEKTIGNFDTNLANTKKYLARVHTHLAELEALVQSPEAFAGELGIEDILIFPVLRNLTMVRGLEMPPKVLAYTLAMSEKSAVPLYFDRAL